uniref:En/Spm-like transposon protein n=1 Tax=Arabidopsis thaliana TaxID=3702 RepID=Q9ZUK5_ARATH|nr:En/Spm-like transposon protein [Arabidopsis thaliana]
MKATPRGYHELETEEEFVEALVSIQENDDLGNESSDDDSFCVRNDCETEEDHQPPEEEGNEEEMAAKEAGTEEEGTEIHSTEETQSHQSATKKRKTRGPTRMRKIAKQPDEKLEVEFTSLGEHVDSFGDNGALWSKTDNLSYRSNPETKMHVGVERHHPWCRATPIPDDNSKTQLIDVLKISKFGPKLSPMSKEGPSRVLGKNKSIDSEMDSSSFTDLKEDAVSQVLGKDKPGRLRGMGSGVTATKLAFMLARDSHVEKLEATQADLLTKLEDLQNVVSGLAAKKLLDWCSDDDVVVGEGEFCSAKQMYKIGRIPLGRNVAAVIAKSVLDATASLWRPTPSVFTLGEALRNKIVWPFDKIILDSDVSSPSENQTAGSSAKDSSTVKIIIIDWNMADSVVDTVHHMPLSPNASKVCVEVSKIGDAAVWRPNSKIQTIVDVVGSIVAWLTDKIMFV